MDQSQLNPNKLVVRDSTRELTYRELSDQVRKACEALHALGVQQGEVIAVEIVDPIDHLVATLALAYLGAVSVSLSISMPNDYVSRVLHLTGCSRIVADNLAHTFARIWPKQVISWPEVVSGTALYSSEPQPRSPKDFWTYVIGSGSTGRRKILPVSHGTQITRALKGADWLPYGDSDVIHSTVPMSYYATKQRFFEALAMGSAMHLGPLSPAQYLSEIEAKKITALYGTVFHFETLLRLLPNEDRPVFGKIKALVIGGSHVSSDLRTRIRNRLSSNLYVVWGTNESHTSTMTRLGQDNDANETVGHPLPGVRLEVVSSADTPLPIGERGRIRVASDSCIDEYLNDDELTQRAFKDGWFYTGDIGYLESSGELVHLGRSDDMMIVNGINLFPAEVEQCLRSYPGVTDAVVAPISSRRHQNIPIALISVSEGVKIDKNQLLSFVQQSIGKYALQDFRIVKSIPRNDQGKLTQASLQGAIKRIWGNLV